MATRMPTAETEQNLAPAIDVPAGTAVLGAEVLAEALRVIDTALAQMMRRELVSAGEVTDVLLDLRMLLTSPAQASA